MFWSLRTQPSSFIARKCGIQLGRGRAARIRGDKGHAFGCAFRYLRSETIIRFMLPKKSSRSSFDHLSLLYEHHGQPFNRQSIIPSVLQWRLLLDVHIDLGEKLVSNFLGAVASPRDPHRHWYGHGLRRWILVLQSYFSTHLDIAAGLTSAGISVL